METIAAALRHILNLLDAFAALALVALAYGPSVRRFGPAASRWLGGVAFGIASALQLATPVMLPAGALLDMRALPVALAAAFLGWQAAIPAIAIAVTARYFTTTGGAEAGVAALLLAACAGLAWRHLTDERLQRGLPSLELLGLLTCLHLLPVLAVEQGLRPALAAGLLPVTAVLNIAGAVFVGWLLEQARWHSVTEAQTIATASAELVSAGSSIGGPSLGEATADTPPAPPPRDRVAGMSESWDTNGDAIADPPVCGPRRADLPSNWPEASGTGEVFGSVSASLFDRTEAMMRGGERGR